jgi:hypothetical protein
MGQQEFHTASQVLNGKNSRDCPGMGAAKERAIAIQPTFDETCIDVGTAWKNYGRASVNIGGQGDSTMATTETSEEINQDRRRFVETAAAGIAAAGTLSLLPERTAARQPVTTQSDRSASIFRKSNSSILVQERITTESLLNFRNWS